MKELFLPRTLLKNSYPTKYFLHNNMSFPHKLFPYFLTLLKNLLFFPKLISLHSFTKILPEYYCSLITHSQLFELFCNQTHAYRSIKPIGKIFRGKFSKTNFFEFTLLLENFLTFLENCPLWRTFSHFSECFSFIF